MHCLALCACGGGSSHSVPTPEPVPADTTTVNLQIIDGYIKGAEVFADLNRNFAKDDVEPYSTSDVNGLVTLNIPNSKLPANKPVKVISQSVKNSDNSVLGVTKSAN